MKKFLLTICLIFSFFILVNSASALSLSPARLELSGYQGDILSGKLKLMNDEQTEKTFYVHYENFDASGESGSPRFLPGDSGLATWIKTESMVTLAPGEFKDVPYTITIPKDAKDGGYFSAIFWSTINPEEVKSGQLSIGAKVGTLVLLRVGDPVVSGNGLKEFSALDNHKFFSYIPVSFVYRFENGGSDRLKPRGSIVIKNIFDKEVATIDANPNDGNVLPGTVRKYEVIWGPEDAKIVSGFFGTVKWQWKNFHLGSYTADITLDYGGDDLAMSSYNFFIVPWQLLATCLVILILLVIFLKLYNKWIISKARR